MNIPEEDLLRPTAGRLGAMERVGHVYVVLAIVEVILAAVVGAFLLLFLLGERI